MPLSGAVVLVTGGSGGIGAAIARAAAEAGADVGIGFWEQAEAAGLVVEDIEQLDQWVTEIVPHVRFPE